jgi:hypothetical protein
MPSSSKKEGRFPRRRVNCPLTAGKTRFLTRTRRGRACPGHPKANAEHSSARREVAAQLIGVFRCGAAWMPGTSPGKTIKEMGDLNLTTGLAEAGQPWDKPGHDEPEVGVAPK